MPCCFFSPSYYVRGARVKQDLRYTQKPIYIHIFTNTIWSYLLWSPRKYSQPITPGVTKHHIALFSLPPSSPLRCLPSITIATDIVCRSSLLQPHMEGRKEGRKKGSQHKLRVARWLRYVPDRDPTQYTDLPRPSPPPAWTRAGRAQEGSSRILPNSMPAPPPGQCKAHRESPEQ